jgi:hypothetical protein
MKRTVGTAVVLALVCGAIWVRPLFLGETFLLRDHASATLPSRAYLAASLREGRIPEWWPAVGLGSNFAGNPNHGVTYPVAWMVALLPDGLGADLLLVLHAFFGALGVALLSRRLGAGAWGERVAGASFAASGYVGSIFINAIPLLTLAWTPWVAWAALGLRERPGLRAGLVVVGLAALQIASGDPAGMITSALVATAVVFPSWRGFVWLVGAWLAAFALAAVAVLPAVALLGESSRVGGLGTDAATVWSLHPLRILAFVWPRVLGDVTDPLRDLGELAASGSGALTGGWALGLYVGVPVLFAAVRSGERRLLVAAGLLLLLALGRFTPVYGLWRLVFLPERFIRYPEKHIAGALVLMTALAGVGVTRLAQVVPRWCWWALGGVVVVLGVGVALVPSDVALSGRDVPAALAEVRGGGLIAIASVVGFGLALALRRGPIVFLAVVLPLVTESWRLQLLGARSVVLAPAGFLVPSVISDARGAAPSGPWPRLFRPQDVSLPTVIGETASGLLAHFATGVPNVAAAHGVAYVPGYDPALASRLHVLWDLASQRGAGTRLLSLLGTEWVVLSPDIARQTPFRPVVTAANGRLVLLQNLRARPRAFATARWAVDADEDRLRDALLSRGADPAVVRVTDPLPAPVGEAFVPCTLDPTSASLVVQRCTVAGPSLAVVLDAWAPGWSASVDGLAAPIHRIDSIVRGVMLPSAGDHVITYRYRAPGLRTGALVSLIALCAWLVAWRRTVPVPPAPRRD